jgi:hypothetical protein
MRGGPPFFEVDDLRFEWRSPIDGRTKQSMIVRGPFAATAFKHKPDLWEGLDAVVEHLPDYLEPRERWADGVPSAIVGTCEAGGLFEEEAWLVLMPTRYRGG